MAAAGEKPMAIDTRLMLTAARRLKMRVVPIERGRGEDAPCRRSVAEHVGLARARQQRLAYHRGSHPRLI
jgi:hypothetical protein